jgi:hypothetical protein
MENLKQGVAPLIVLRKELHKYPKFWKSSNAKNHFFSGKYPTDEIITNIGETGIIAIYNGEKPGKQSCLDVS